MKRFASLLSRAVLAALLLMSVSVGVASADTGDLSGATVDAPPQHDSGSGAEPALEIQLPEDPGIQMQLPEDPGIPMELPEDPGIE
jgi:hypothetical protein